MNHAKRHLKSESGNTLNLWKMKPSPFLLTLSMFQYAPPLKNTKHTETIKTKLGLLGSLGHGMRKEWPEN